MKKLIIALVLLGSFSALCGCQASKESVSVAGQPQTVTTAETTTSAAASYEAEPSSFTGSQEETSTAEETTEPVKDESWKQVYINYLNSSENTDNHRYALVYLDSDNIPELFERGYSRRMGNTLYWIYNGSMCSENLVSMDLEYYEYENYFLSMTVEAGIQSDLIYQINKSELEELYRGMASRVIKGQERFNWNGEEVSEEEYNSLRADAFDSSKAKKTGSYETADRMISEIQNY